MTDHDELRTLIQRYARGADDRNIDVLASIFDPDAEMEGARGKQAFPQWLDMMREPRTFPTSMHVLGDPLIELDAEAGRATLDTYAVVYQLGDNGDMTLGMRYFDEAERRDGRWVIVRRKAQTLWMR